MAVITGNSGNNYLDGTIGDDTIYGLDGDDTLVGNGGTDVLYGGNGDDRYWVKDAGDLVVETGTGYDAVWSEISYTLTANVEELDLLGTANIDATGNELGNWIFDNSGNNHLYGLGGNDTLVATNGGTDTLIGGDGDDTYWINNASDVIVETNTADYDAVWSEVSYTLPTNVEELDLLGTANINGSGNAGDNYLFGNSGNNNLNGFGGNDTIYGGDGDDTLQGGGGADSLVGGDGSDYYYVDNSGDVVVEDAGGTGWDQVESSISYTLTANVEELDLLGTANINATGNGLDNYIYGNSGNNTLSGLAGNDTIDATAGGIDTLVGGTGDDTYWIGNGADVITETNTSDWDAVWSSFSYTLPTNVEELDLLGTANINATGNSGINFLYGNSGNNYLNGLAGNDTLIGNAGNDTLQGGGGADSMQGGAGDDYYYVDNAGDVVSEETTAGIDDGGYDHVASSITYTLGAHIEELDQIGTANINGTGNGLDNYLYGNVGNNVLSGLAGNDTIDASSGGIDTLVGGTGDDTYWIGNGADVITETNTSDWDAVWSSFSYTLPTNVEELDLLGTANINATGNSGINFLYGNSGNNYLNGLAGNDTLIGNAGNDTLQGGGGADSMQGGAGDDYYYVDNTGDVVSEETTVGIDDGGYDHVASSITYTLGAHIEELDQIGTANINGTGNGLDNYLYGNVGNNTLSGLAGNDTIDATAGGIDTLVGGTGDDTYWIGNGADVIIETNTTDYDVVWSGVSYTLPTNVEELDLLGTANINGTGNSGDNYLFGNSGNNNLNGLAGNDTIYGYAGNDTLQGGGGADSLVGGAGDDYYYVDNTGDVVSEETTVGVDDGGYDHVASSITYTLGAHIEELDQIGTANINGTGNGLDNYLYGNVGNNILSGLAGNDTIDATAGGTDTLIGGDGDDTYWITNASDVIIETNTTDYDVIWSGVSYTLPTNVEELDLLGTANINGTGNSGDNYIFGNSGNNVLTGLGGNDTLQGGGGADSFVFSAAGSANGVDFIQDFVHGTDQLVFGSADYGFAAGHSLTASEFTVGGSASGASAQFVWDSTTHTLYFDHDGAGGDAAIAIATFDAGATLTASDFHFA